MTQALAKPKGRTASAATRYEDDLCAWVDQQVALLRGGRIGELDLHNIAEELSDVGKTQSWRLWSVLRVLVMHMLKWDQQLERQSASWVRSIREQRRRYAKLLKTSPSLKTQRDEILADVYPTARDWASEETHIPEDEFPAECPYDWEDILERPFDLEATERRTR